MNRYERELKTALESAHEAGNRLREWFADASGRVREIDHAVEESIEQSLLGAFPDYGYRGEELHRPRSPQDAAGHLWLVDPNDGTRAAVEGFRGAAVSIALLRDGEPVLGVVYAYSAPDDDGDLFWWAENHGPVRRNGIAIERAWPTAPSAANTALVSQHADKNSAANAAALAPMRFRAIPGIAYRLALVAAGEGDLAISLNGPVGWDYAGGHALLKGAGADLYDSDLQPIRYSRGGDSHCRGGCFGGPLPLVAHAGRSDWTRVHLRPSKNPASYALCWPPKENPVGDAGMLRRAQGCLVGQLSGDSLGSLVEFRDAADIARQYPGGVRELADGGTFNTIAGQPTDDSEMALMLARSILKAGTYDDEAAARAYASWHLSHPFDEGTTTRAALGPAAAALRENRPVAEAARQACSRGSEANGGLMRISPLGILGATSPVAKLREWAQADARLTHCHQRCQDANVLFASAIAFAITSGEPREAVHGYTLKLAEEGLDARLMEALHDAAIKPPADYLYQQGWVVTAFHNAFYQLLHADSFEAGVVDTVRRGGDTDTNGAIAGALLGAVRGLGGVPKQWVDRVLTCRPMAGVARPRPEEFWPVDALWLAEHLLLLGG